MSWIFPRSLLFCLVRIECCIRQGRGHAQPPTVIPGHAETLDFMCEKPMILLHQEVRVNFEFVFFLRQKILYKTQLK